LLSKHTLGGVVIQSSKYRGRGLDSIPLFQFCKYDVRTIYDII